MGRKKLLPEIKKAVNGWRADRHRYSWVYCPICWRDLNGDNESFVEDKELVEYKCATCGCVSRWLFDAPVPIIISHQILTKKIYQHSNIKGGN